MADLARIAVELSRLHGSASWDPRQITAYARMHFGVDLLHAEALAVALAIAALHLERGHRP